MKSFALTLAACAAFAGAQDTNKIDGFVTQLMQKRSVPCVSIAVVQGGAITYTKGYGLADVENDVKATPETVYEIGSVTKQFTAAIVLQLVDEGKVNLDEPARKYLPSMPESWKAVTVRQLLTHTSGIPSYTEIPGFDKRFREPLVGGDFFSLVSGVKSDFAPGERWKYNNSGYFLLGLLIEKVTGHTYAQELKTRIFDPLDMRDTRVNDPQAIVKRRAKGYAVLPGKGVVNADYIDMGWPFSAGAIASTVLDLAKWDGALYGDKLLKQSVWKEAWTPVKLLDGKTYPYGFGWALGDLNGIPILEHGGDIPGFNADILRIPSKKLTIIVLCNADPGLATAAARGIAGIVEPAVQVEVKAIADPDPAETARHKRILVDAAAGKLNKDLFTPEVQARIWPTAAEQVREFLRQLGPITAFTLIKVEEKNGDSVRIYRATLGGQDLNMTVATNKAGKIAGFSLTPG